MPLSDDAKSKGKRGLSRHIFVCCNSLRYFLLVQIKRKFLLQFIINPLLSRTSDVCFQVFQRSLSLRKQMCIKSEMNMWLIKDSLYLGHENKVNPYSELLTQNTSINHTSLYKRNYNLPYFKYTEETLYYIGNTPLK